MDRILSDSQFNLGSHCFFFGNTGGSSDIENADSADEVPDHCFSDLRHFSPGARSGAFIIPPTTLS